ncbi:excisionase family DNA-binding protein [Hyphomicrobium sp. DY-1]|uniref:excisionase family DNA-binding protein n=1 Tax=Hyphomicrobium sp. DY-1 TaxID=3075650 RepID=UPI0039C12611
MIEKLAYSPSEAQIAASCGKTFLYEAIGRGDLPSLKCGRKRLIMRDDLHAWLKTLRDRACGDASDGEAA